MDSYTPRFIRAYLECILWAETDNSTESGGYPLEDNYTTDDFHPDSRRRAASDCTDFLYFACPRVASVMDPEQAGHDFWLTRNGHGTGYWDRGLGEDGARFTEAAKAYGSSDVYIGDDGMLHLS